MKKICLTGLLVTALLAVSGCKYLISPMVSLLPQAPKAAQVAPKIADLMISPNQIQAGASATLSFAFSYEDLNSDVGPNSAQVELQGNVVSGNFQMDTSIAQAVGAVMADDAAWGRKGRVTVVKTVNVPASASGVINFTVTLVDSAGQRSNSLSAQVTVLASQQGGGIGPTGKQCTIIDGNGQPTTSVRIGRQVFFRVNDQDNNFSSDTQDRLFRTAYFQGGASGDVEIIFWLLETGSNTGIFEGPPGGILLTSRFPVVNNGELSVLDNDTVIAYYEDPNGPGDICMAMAKVN